MYLGGPFYPWNDYGFWGHPLWWGSYGFYPRYGSWYHRPWGMWYYPWSYSWFNPDLDYWYYPRFGMTVHIEKRECVVYVENTANQDNYFAVYHRQATDDGYELDRVYLSEKGLASGERVKVRLPGGADPKDYVVIVDQRNSLSEVLQQDADGKPVEAKTARRRSNVVELEAELLNKQDERYYAKIQKARGEPKRYEKIQAELDQQAAKLAKKVEAEGEDAADEGEDEGE